MRIAKTLLAAALLALTPFSARAQTRQPILAVFAHPDDERVIGPLLSRLAREGRETHLVIATDGAKGVTPFAHIPEGAALAAERTKEATCAANRLGVKQLHLLGLPDGGLASFGVLGKLRSSLAAIIDSLKPAAIITFGPEGGTGHPDHRLVGDVVTQIIESDARYSTIDLLYASLPTERLRTAPRANPSVNGMAESLLTVRVPFEDRDLIAGREEYACHRTQYTPAQMDSVNKYLARSERLQAVNGFLFNQRRQPGHRQRAHAARSSVVTSGTTLLPSACERNAASMIAITVAPCSGGTGFGALPSSVSRSAT